MNLKGVLHARRIGQESKENSENEPPYFWHSIAENKGVSPLKQQATLAAS